MGNTRSDEDRIIVWHKCHILFCHLRCMAEIHLTMCPTYYLSCHIKFTCCNQGNIHTHGSCSLDPMPKLWVLNIHKSFNPSECSGLIVTKLCNYGVMTREPVEGFVLILSFGAGLHCWECFLRSFSDLRQQKQTLLLVHASSPHNYTA